MKTKKIPLRMCIVTREMLPKKDLVRVVKTQNNEFALDFTGKLNGRGAYLTNSLEVIQKCIKTKALNRAFGQAVSETVYTQILEEFLARNKQ